MYESEDENEYTISQVKDELKELDKNMENFVKFIIGRHNINLKTELELYKTEQEKIKIGCKHSNVFILDCPLVKGNYIHVSHRSNCKTCYNIMCSGCRSKFQCKSCYNDTQKNNYFENRLDSDSDSYDIYFTSSDEYKNRKYQKKY